MSRGQRDLGWKYKAELEKCLNSPQSYLLAWDTGSVGFGSFQRKTTLSWLTLTSSSTAFIPAAMPAVVAAAVFSQAVWAEHQVR